RRGARARLGGAPGAARPVHVHRAHLEADRVRRLAVTRASGEPQADFVGLRPDLHLIMQARHADQVDAEIVVDKALQFQAFLDNLWRRFGTSDGVDAAVGDLAFTDIAVGITYIDLIGLGARLRPGAFHPHTVCAVLSEHNARDIERAVR